MKSKISFLVSVALSITFIAAKAPAAPLIQDKAQALFKPLWDGLDFFIVDPVKGIPTFFKESVDDFAEEVVKFGVLYVTYRYSPMATSGTLVQASSFPVVYMVANLLGDIVDKRIERLQPGNDDKPHRTVLADVIRKHDAVGKLIKDAVEDGFKVGCYASKFAKGFAPSMIWAQFVQRFDGPHFAVLALKGYAYFAASTKMFTDTNQCTRSSDEYGTWAEDQWNALKF